MVFRHGRPLGWQSLGVSAGEASSAGRATPPGTPSQASWEVKGIEVDGDEDVLVDGPGAGMPGIDEQRVELDLPFKELDKVPLVPLAAALWTRSA